MRKCPFGKDKTQLCLDSCITRGKYIPRLECDYFEHFRKTKVYRVERHTKATSTYTEHTVVSILDNILDRLGGSDELLHTEAYTLSYGDLVVGVYPTVDLAKQASKNFKNTSLIKIERTKKKLN